MPLPVQVQERLEGLRPHKRPSRYLENRLFYVLRIHKLFVDEVELGNKPWLISALRSGNFLVRLSFSSLQSKRYKHAYTLAVQSALLTLNLGLSFERVHGIFGHYAFGHRSIYLSIAILPLKQQPEVHRVGYFGLLIHGDIYLSNHARATVNR